MKDFNSFYYKISCEILVSLIGVLFYLIFVFPIFECCLYDFDSIDYFCFNGMNYYCI